MKRVIALIFASVFVMGVALAQNLISDPSFESGKLGEWVLEQGKKADCFVENNKNNAHTGKWTYKYWKATAFQSLLTRKVTGLENGTYSLSIWAMGGGGENEIRFYSVGHDSSGKEISTKITNTGWKNWKQYTLEVPVSTGELTIGIYLDAKGDCWGNFDDVELVKK